MKRDIDIKEISDGKLYTANDMVKTDCHDCLGCSECCRGMGSSILLDPMDIWRMTSNLHTDFNSLLDRYVELGMVDGLILPNLKLAGDGESCSFLSAEGRCGIHSFRPGICRLFPLGRIYEEEGFKYFLQVHECPKTNKSKVKIKKWLDTPDLKTYERYICDWHYFLKELQERTMENPDLVKDLSMIVLKLFFMMPYAEEDFYKQFYRRLSTAKNRTK